MCAAMELTHNGSDIGGLMISAVSRMPVGADQNTPPNHIAHVLIAEVKIANVWFGRRVMQLKTGGTSGHA